MTDTSKTNEEIARDSTMNRKNILAQTVVNKPSDFVDCLYSIILEALQAKDAQRDEAVREAVREEALWWFRLNTSFMKCARMQDIGELNRLCNLIEERVKTLNETTPQEGTPNTTHHG